MQFLTFHFYFRTKIAILGQKAGYILNLLTFSQLYRGAHAFIWHQLFTCLQFFVYKFICCSVCEKGLFHAHASLLSVPPIGLWGLCVWSLFCYTLLSVLSSYAIILTMVTGCFTLIVVLMSCDFWCSVALPRGAVV